MCGRKPVVSEMNLNTGVWQETSCFLNELEHCGVWQETSCFLNELEHCGVWQETSCF